MQKSDPGLNNMAFPFIRVAPRPGKPRDTGLTIVADRGIAMNRVEDLIDAGGEFIDYVKIGIGAFRLQTEDLLRRKIAALHRAKIKVFLAGDVTEAALQQGVSAQFYKAVKKYGAEAVEVSNAQVSVSLRDKCELIRMATGEGLQVVAEAGQKGIDDWTSSQSYVFSTVEAYRKAGAWKVLVQGEGVSEGVAEFKGDFVLNLVGRFNANDFIFQAKDGGTQMWYVNTLGNQANLDIDDHQVIDLELMRRGIRKRGLYGLVASL